MAYHADVILEKGVIVTSGHKCHVTSSHSNHATTTTTTMSIISVTHFHVSPIATSPQDIPTYQVIPTAFPHPTLTRFAWVVDHRFGAPQAQTGTQIFLWFPRREDLITATIGSIFRINEEYIMFELHSQVLGPLPPLCIPRDPSLAPPLELTALRFIAYVQLGPPPSRTEPRWSTEAVTGHTPPQD